MTQIPNNLGDEGNTSDPNAITYPVDQMRNIGIKLYLDAETALQQHETIWQWVKSWLASNDDKGYYAAVLNPHEQRMRASFAWQQQLGQTLVNAADLADSTDDSTAQSFTKNGHTYS